MENQFTPSNKMLLFITDALKLLIENYQSKIEHLNHNQKDKKSELENDLGFVRAVLQSLETQKNNGLQDSVLISLKEYYLLKQSLNEICNGAYALPKEEFQTLVGLSKDETLEILDKIKFPEKNHLTFKYQIFQDKENADYIMQSYHLEFAKNWELLLTFEAENYDEAKKVYNRFLGFGEYSPNKD